MTGGNAGSEIQRTQNLGWNHRSDNERRVLTQQRVIRRDHRGQSAEHGYPNIPADISNPEAVSQKPAEEGAGGA